jgi:hypothetical protein
MIDYIKAHFSDKVVVEKNLKNRDTYQPLEQKYDLTNSSLEYPLRTQIDGLHINITNKGGYVENSIHKYYNEIAQNPKGNYNDFYYCDLVCTLNILQQELKYDLRNTTLTNLEFGFNIHIGINPTDFLENHVLMCDFKSPCYNPKNSASMKIKKFTYEQFEIKIYNKSLQYNLMGNNSDILRVEIKYKTKKILNQFGIYNLMDLQKPECISALFKDFIKRLGKLQIVDSYNGSDKMTKKEREEFIRFTNDNYWIKLRKEKPNSSCLSKKNKYEKMVKKYELDSWRKQLRKLLIDKFHQLFITDCIPQTESYKLVA